MSMLVCNNYLNGIFIFLFINCSVGIACAGPKNVGIDNIASAAHASAVKNAELLISDYKYHQNQILVKYKPGHFPELFVSAKKKILKNHPTAK